MTASGSGRYGSIKTCRRNMAWDAVSSSTSRFLRDLLIRADFLLASLFAYFFFSLFRRSSRTIRTVFGAGWLDASSLWTYDSEKEEKRISTWFNTMPVKLHWSVPSCSIFHEQSVVNPGDLGDAGGAEDSPGFNDTPFCVCLNEFLMSSTSNDALIGNAAASWLFLSFDCGPVADAEANWEPRWGCGLSWDGLIVRGPKACACSKAIAARVGLMLERRLADSNSFYCWDDAVEGSECVLLSLNCVAGVDAATNALIGSGATLYGGAWSYCTLLLCVMLNAVSVVVEFTAFLRYLVIKWASTFNVEASRWLWGGATFLMGADSLCW